MLAVLRNQAVTTTRPRRALDSRALSGSAHQTHPLHGAPPSNTMHQHLTPLRTRVPEISSDFALLCACAHSDATFYEANSSRTAARSVNGRRQSPAAIAIDHRPSQTSSSIRLRPQLPPRALFRGVPHTEADSLTVCADRACSAGRLHAGSAAAGRGREAAEQSRNGRRACVVSGGSLAPITGLQPGVPAWGWADLPPNRWALTPKRTMAAHGRTLSRLSYRTCVCRACAAA